VRASLGISGLYPLLMTFRFDPTEMSLRDRFCPAPVLRADPNAEARAAQALAGRRGRMRIPPAPGAGKAAARVLQPLTRDTGLGLNEMKRRWSDVAGLPFANICAPVKLAAGVLVLSASGAQTPLITHSAGLLIERLRTAGAKVTTIRIEQRTAAAPRPNLRPRGRALTPLEEAALDAAVGQKLDPALEPGLKTALMRLGRAVTRG
jgi:hypothetical protein